MFLKLCASILLFLLVASCGEVPPNNVKAPEHVADSFIFRSGDFSLEDREESGTLSRSSNTVGINISSLDKEFLLQGSLIMKPLVRRFENLKSRVVAFKLIDDFLYMLEATKGHDIYAEVTKDIILAKFPVKEITKDSIFFDFATGMSKVFMAGDWQAQDFSGADYPFNQWDSYLVDSSYLKSAELDDHNNLVIHQVAQLNSSGAGSTNKTPVEIKYYLTPYKENPSFTPTESKMKTFETMGFFEATPQNKAGGKTVVYATKFDHSKPIIYAISSNTPKEYREAIRNGVLYWNKAFGKEIVQVVDAPEGVSAPSFNYNIIQWVDWKDAGFAYADAQIDPRTGEILHAQVFMTSVFAFSGKKRAKKLLDRLLDHKDHVHFSLEDKTLDELAEHVHKKEISHKHHDVPLSKAFKKESMCNFEPSQSMVEGLTHLLSSAEEFDDSVYLKASQDYVAETIAHEVGHTLGLRHNFAGSLYSNLDIFKKDEALLEYAKNKKAPEGIITTSSVMEYQLFTESVITGDQLVTRENALDYDVAVIGALYNGKKYRKSKLPPFCTDTGRSEYLDCRVFDSGNSVYKSALYQEKYYERIIPNLVLEGYLTAKKKIEEGEFESLKEGSFEPLSLVFNALSDRMTVLKSFSKGTNFLKVTRQFPVLGVLDGPELKKAKVDYIQESLDEVQGIENVFKSVGKEEVSSMRKKFKELLDSYQNKALSSSDVTLFSEEEVGLIDSESDKFFENLSKAYLAVDLLYFKFTKKLMNESFTEDLTKIMEERVKSIILMKDGEETVKVGEKTVTFPKFAFSYPIRSTVSSLLKGASSEPYWGVPERYRIKAELGGLVEKVLGEELSKKDPEELPKALGKWVYENKNVKSSL